MKISLRDKVKYLIKEKMDIAMEDKIYTKKCTEVKIKQNVRKTYFLSRRGNLSIFKYIEVTRKNTKTVTKIVQNYRYLKDLEINNIDTISVEYTKHVRNRLIKEVSKTLECGRNLVSYQYEYNYDEQGRLHGRKYGTDTLSKYSNGNYIHGIPHGLHVRRGIGGMCFLDLDYNIYNKGKICERIDIFKSIDGSWFEVFVDGIYINDEYLTSLEGKSEEFIRNFIHKVTSNIYKYSDEYSRVENINTFIRRLSWTILKKDVNADVRTVVKNIIENNKGVL